MQMSFETSPWESLIVSPEKWNFSCKTTLILKASTKTYVEDRTNKPLQTSSKGIYVAHIDHPQYISYYTQICLSERE